MLLLTIFNLTSVGKPIIEYEFLFLTFHPPTVPVGIILFIFTDERKRRWEENHFLSCFVKTHNHFVLNSVQPSNAYIIFKNPPQKVVYT